METLIEQYKKDQGNLPCKLAIACARPLSEAEVNTNTQTYNYTNIQLYKNTIKQIYNHTKKDGHCLNQATLMREAEMNYGNSETAMAKRNHNGNFNGKWSLRLYLLVFDSPDLNLFERSSTCHISLCYDVQRD